MVNVAITITWLAAVSIGIYFLTRLVLATIRRRYSTDLRYDEIHNLTTSDGAELQLFRLRGQGEVQQPRPVLLLHGLGMNHRNVDMLEDKSLARYLAGFGHDVWIASMRSATRQNRTVDGSMHAMATLDIPALVEAVCQHTGSNRVSVVGFSMGGLVAAAALRSEELSQRLHRFVTLGTPLSIDEYPLRFALGRFSTATQITMPFAATFVWLAPFAGLRAAAALYAPNLNPNNVDREDVPFAAMLCADIAPSLVQSFLSWKYSPDTTFTFEHLRGQTAPALFIAGGEDTIARPASVAALASKWGTEHQRPALFRELASPHVVCGYAHGDLMMGTRVNEEVFAPIHEFLRSSDQNESQETVAAVDETQSSSCSLSRDLLGNKT